MLCRALALDHAADGIRVNIVCPARSPPRCTRIGCAAGPAAGPPRLSGCCCTARRVNARSRTASPCCAARRTILVDSGYQHAGRGRELADEDGISVSAAQRAGRAGAAPGDVDAFVVTHAHFDHLGNVAAFPNATVYIQRREVEKWSWAVSLPRSMDWLKQGVSLDDLATLPRLAGEGRLRLVDGPAEDVFPGVSLVPDFDTHTYGHQHVVIRTASSGVWVVPGDVMFLYANIEGIGGDGRYVPIGLAMGSQESMLALDELMRVTGGETSQHPARAREAAVGAAPVAPLPPTACTWPRYACGRATEPAPARGSRRRAGGDLR